MHVHFSFAIIRISSFRLQDEKNRSVRHSYEKKRSLLTIGDKSPIIFSKEDLIDMPTISHFYGIIIVMYLRNKEHNPPHVHAITQEFDAPFLIASGEIMDGEFPLKAKLLVKEFILKYQKELEEMWETEEYRKLPPLN